MTSPIRPRGLGTGHSWPLLARTSLSMTVSSACRWGSLDVESSNCNLSGPCRLRLLRRPSSITWTSANSVRGAGQGSKWGMPTTRNETRRVAPKREVVYRDLGCRWEGIVRMVYVKRRGLSRARKKLWILLLLRVSAEPGNGNYLVSCCDVNFIDKRQLGKRDVNDIDLTFALDITGQKKSRSSVG